MILFNNNTFNTISNNLLKLGAQLEASNVRLSTAKKVNKASDDPSGIIALGNLNKEIARIDAMSRNGQRMKAIADTADGAVSEISTLVVSIQTDMLSAAGVTATAEEKAAYQANIDNAIDSINRLVGSTSFNGTTLLDGSMGYTTSGVTSSDIADVKINSAPGTSTSVSLSVALTAGTQATMTSNAFATTADDVTFTLTGSSGSETLTYASGTTRAAMIADITANAGTTGVTATESGGSILLTNVYAGANEQITMNITDGTSLTVEGTETSATTSGTDGTVTVNGQSATITSASREINFNVSGVNGSLTMAQDFFGSTVDTSTSFSVSGTGAGFSFGTESYDTVDFGMDSLYASALGTDSLGYLSTLKSGGANDISSGNFSTASSIVSKASTQASTARARLGTLSLYTVDTTLNSIEDAKTSLTDARSYIEDTDFITETANNDRLQTMMQIGISLIDTLNNNSLNVLSLFK